MRYLTEDNIRAALHRGKSVEQFLGGSSVEGAPTIRRLVLAPTQDLFRLTLYESFDDGSDTFIDVYEFSSIDPDEDPKPEIFESFEEALARATSTYGALSERWVNQFVVQDEYADYRRSRTA